MAAISDTLFTLLAPGDRVVAIKDTYGGTNKIFLEFLPRAQINVSLCDTLDADTIEAEIGKGCKVLYLETPTNPVLKIVDIPRLARAAHKQGVIVIVDNTFATPINQRPLELGADLAVYSDTKYLNGHSDAMGGIFCGLRELVNAVLHYREINGSVSTLAGPPMATSHVELTAAERDAMAIPESLIRYSTGIENVEDLISDLDGALARL